MQLVVESLMCSVLIIFTQDAGPLVPRTSEKQVPGYNIIPANHLEILSGSSTYKS